MSDVIIDQIGGNCPVQAEGTICGKPFYFRARGEGWRMNIGGSDVVGNPEWSFYQEYGDDPHAAGWMSVEDAAAFIRMAADKYTRENPDA